MKYWPQMAGPEWLRSIGRVGVRQDKALVVSGRFVKALSKAGTSLCVEADRHNRHVLEGHVGRAFLERAPAPTDQGKWH